MSITTTFRLPALIAAATTMALIAGFFYAYTSSVTLGLGRLDDSSYVSAMQSINDTVRNPAFALSFFGALLTTGVAFIAYRGEVRVRRLIALAGVVYLIGGLGLTFMASVPLNDQLAGVDALAAGAAEQARDDYEAEWNAWNLVRTLFSTAALVVLLAALTVARRSNANASGDQPPRQAA